MDVGPSKLSINKIGRYFMGAQYYYCLLYLSGTLDEISNHGFVSTFSWNLSRLSWTLLFKERVNTLRSGPNWAKKLFCLVPVKSFEALSQTRLSSAVSTTRRLPFVQLQCRW